MLSWESKKIGYTGLLKSTLKLAKTAISNAGIKPAEIGLIVHGGVYREHFRTEPAFATHIQGDLGIQCHGIGLDSQSCFSFDVTDGSCSHMLLYNRLPIYYPLCQAIMPYCVLEMTARQNIVIGNMSLIVLSR